MGTTVEPLAHCASWYADTAIAVPDFPALAGEQRADVCVVGGGYTGLSCALRLRELGLDVVLVEAQRMGWGASGRNGGQLGSGQRRDPEWLLERYGPERARQLWQLGEDAKDLVRGRVAEHGIPCDLRPGIVHAAHKAAYVPEYHAEAQLLREQFDYDQVELLDRGQIRERLGSDAFHGGVVDHGAAHLHPLNLALGLARAAAAAGARLHDGTCATSHTRGPDGRVMVRTSSAAGDGVVVADHMVFATNGYLGRLEPRLAGRIMPINNFVVATAPLGEERARSINRHDEAVADSRFVVNYWRLSSDHRLLFGGGENYRRGFPRDIAAFVRPHLLSVYPQLADVAIHYAWGGTLGITMNRMPHVGRLDPQTWFAQGFSGHGVAMANLSGHVIAEAIAGTAGRFDLLAGVRVPPFPGGRMLRWPAQVLGMLWYALRDRL